MRIAPVLTLTLTLTLGGLTSTAVADDDIVGNSTGGGFVPGDSYHYTPHERRLVAAEARDDSAYLDWVDGKIDAEEYSARHTAIQQRFDIDLPTHRLAPAHRIEARVLPLRQRGQTKPWNCGAAVGTMIAALEGKRRSAATGHRLSQRAMGNRAHMKTNIYHITRYASSLFPRGLNRWLKGTRRGPYHQYNSPGPRRMRGALVVNIDDGEALALSTVEFADSYHYNHHPGRKLIGHWVAARGYGNYGRRMTMADSSTTVWRGPQRYFATGTGRFARLFLQSNGIAR